MPSPALTFSFLRPRPAPDPATRRRAAGRRGLPFLAVLALFGLPACAAPALAPPASPLVDPSASVASTPPPAPAFLPVLTLAWSIDEPFLDHATVRVTARPLDADALRRQLPVGARQAFGAGQKIVDAGLIKPPPHPPRRARPPAASPAGRLLAVEQAAGDLETAAARAQGEPAAAAWLAAASFLVALADTRLSGASSGPDRSAADDLLERAARDLARAVALVPANVQIGIDARYREADLLARLGRGDRGRADLEAIVPAAGDLAPEIALRLGLLLGAGPGADPARAAATFRAGLGAGVPMSAGLRGGLVHALMVACYRASDVDGALAEAVDFLVGFYQPATRSQPAVDGALRVAADLVDRAGSIAPLTGRQAPAPVVVEVALRVASRALRRGDRQLARELADAALEAAPGDPRAADARKILELAAPGRPEEAPADALQARGQALVRLCLEPEGWRLRPADGLVIEVEALVDRDGAAAVRARRAEGTAPIDGALRCIEQRGPVYFRAAPASLRGRASY